MKLDFDFENQEIVMQLIRAIEKEYGKSVVRIPYLEPSEEFMDVFEIRAIFSDFGLLEGHIVVESEHDHVTVRVEGTYY